MSDAKKRSTTLQIGGTPFADLLPPEIALEAKASAQRRSMFALVALVILVVVAGYFGVSFLTSQAQAQLAASQAETASLLSEQAEYAEVRTMQSKSAAIRVDQKFATSTEIDWKAYLESISDALPGGASLYLVNMTSATPITPLAASASPLGTSYVAEISLSATTNDVPDIVDWLDGLSTLKGYADATPTSVTKIEGGYDLSFTMHVNSDALFNRFADEEATK